MMRAYKFVSLDYADLVASGGLKIGSLRGYADLEDQERADAQEGFDIARLNYDGLTITPEVAAQMAKYRLNFPVGAYHAVITDNIIVNRFPNRHCFCMSTTINAAPKQEHAAFEILGVRGLARAISNLASDLLGVEVAAGRVVYGDREHAVMTSEPRAPDPFLKPASFSWEKEVRLLWPNPPVLAPGDSLTDVFLKPDPTVAEWLRRIY